MEHVAGTFGRRCRQRRRVPSYKPHINNIPRLDQGLPITNGILPGSAESHKGTKLLFDEDRLRLILSTALSDGTEYVQDGAAKILAGGMATCKVVD